MWNAPRPVRLGSPIKMRVKIAPAVTRRPTGRATGALQGVRGKVWRRLYDQMDRFTDNLLFTRADLEAAHDAMNERPLYEAATQRLANAVRDRSVDDLAALVVDLHNGNRLCVPRPQDGSHAGPTIVCTMGITGSTFLMAPKPPWSIRKNRTRSIPASLPYPYASRSGCARPPTATRS